MICKSYLPFSLIEQEAVKASYIAFAKEYGADFSVKPAKFVTATTVQGDIDELAQFYLKEVISLITDSYPSYLKAR